MVFISDEDSVEKERVFYDIQAFNPYQTNIKLMQKQVN